MSRTLLLAGSALLALSCARTATTTTSVPAASGMSHVNMSPGEPLPDPRVGLRAGLHNAADAAWNMRLVSTKPTGQLLEGGANTDLAFLGNYAIQGNYRGWQFWDISDVRNPKLRTTYLCPASQSDVSAYKNLLFISGEDLAARIDCGVEGVRDTVSKDRLRGLRIFDISNIDNPRNVGNVQTCRGSHTHSLLVDPKDKDNVYVYISGSSAVRSPNELPGCSALLPEMDPNSALFRIEVIKVPLANPERAAIVSSPRIFQDLEAPARHGETRADSIANAKNVADAKARGEYTAVFFGAERVLPPTFSRYLLDSLVRVRGGSGAPTSQDSATLRRELPTIIARIFHDDEGPRRGPTQCHDITLYPGIGRAGGACEGYGFLLDISDPANPVRLSAVADSNFSYWHSATFNNDGTQILFSDEWGGGGQPKCRSTDPREWGADAIFTVSQGRAMNFQSYYKLPAAQTPQENCVAHNGSLIPVPGRDIMVQAWYQGGISVFDWTDPRRPVEIAYYDRGPIDSTRFTMGGSWSAYWYNGVIVSSEIARGLDILELTPSPHLSQNEIDAAKLVKYEYWNTQGQQKFVWPASFSVARAYVDQLERMQGLGATRITSVRDALRSAEAATGDARRTALNQLANQLANDATSSSRRQRVNMLIDSVKDLAAAAR
jgi:hypothetical protein